MGDVTARMGTRAALKICGMLAASTLLGATAGGMGGTGRSALVSGAVGDSGVFIYVDVSHYDEARRGGRAVDWAALSSAGLGQVMCTRVSYGDPAGFWRPSPYGTEHLDGAERAGYQARGGYHNLVHSDDDAGIDRQVEAFHAALDSGNATWAMLDVEPYPELVSAGQVPVWSDVTRFAQRWAQVAGTRVLALYLPRWVWSQMGRPDLTGWDGPLINADYSGAGAGGALSVYAQAGGNTASGWRPYGGRVPDVLQFTSSARVSMLSAETDMDAYRGSAGELLSLLAQKGG